MLSPGSTYSEEFPAVPDSVPKARAAVAGFALAAGASSEQLQSVQLAASEAVTNVVLHAYRGGSGSFQVMASYVPDEIWVLVGDDGAGLSSQSSGGGLGVGLVIIAAMADTFEIVRRSTGGTELHMRFRLRVTDAATDAEPRKSEAAQLSLA